MEVNTSSTALIQCGGTLYERDAFLGALVRTEPTSRNFHYWIELTWRGVSMACPDLSCSRVVHRKDARGTTSLSEGTYSMQAMPVGKTLISALLIHVVHLRRAPAHKGAAPPCSMADVIHHSLAMQAGNCTVQCLQREPCASPAAPAPEPERLLMPQPFQARHRYQPAPVEAPVLAAAAPAPQSNAVCSCSSADRGMRPGPSMSFQYAGENAVLCLLAENAMHALRMLLQRLRATCDITPLSRRDGSIPCLSCLSAEPRCRPL